MEVKTTILTPFFQKPKEAFHIREVAKLTGINHTTVRKYLQEMVKEGILVIKEDKLYDMYLAADSSAFHNILLYYTLEKIRTSKFLAEIEKNDQSAAVVLLTITESLELCVIYQKKHEYSLKELENSFGKKIACKYYDAKKLKSYLKSETLLSQSIMNGVVVKGKIIIANLLLTE